MSSIDTAPSNRFADAIELTQDTLRRATAGLPAAVRFAMGYAIRIRRGTLALTLPDGRRLVARGAEPGPEAEMVIRDFAFASRLATKGDLGFAEAFLRGEWDSPDPAGFLYFFCVNHEAVTRLMGHNPIVRILQVYRHWRNKNTKAQARRNIIAHYDLGNSFYRAWLDPSMTYSSAYFGSGATTLPDAQRAKYRHLAEQMGIKPGDRVLEIGCGWGGFAEVAATEFGAHVTGLTISNEQFDYATKRMADAGLSDRVVIKLQDYRDETGVYDHVASIEMFEAVGKHYWRTYFDKVVSVLKPGGRAGLQVITITERLWENYQREIDFIRGYIFPGGMLPTVTHMHSLGKDAGLGVVADTSFGLDYARTLNEWCTRFGEAWPDLTNLGFDDRFRRLWLYYLAYCEAGFRSNQIDVHQYVYAKA
ncbi:MAG: cyclopropane-fatty-acyl-phospholipid synthase family protein [Alphaproteobacteria bacterium]